MLNGIKSIINRTSTFQESAGIILEETGINIDDLIVLGEDTDNINQLDLDNVEGDENDITDNIDNNEDDNNEDDNKPGNDINNDDLSNTDNNDISIPDDKPGEPPTNEPNQILSNDEEDKDPMQYELDELPTPIGKQTGEPVNDDIDDIMHMEIDLKSNTISDALPIPPGNANEAIVSDEINPQQHVDSGFGGEGEESTVEESVNKSNDNWKDIKNSLYDKLDEFDVKVSTDKKSGGITVKVFNKDDKELKNIKAIIKKISKKNNLKIDETIDGSKLFININNSKPITEGINLAGGMEGSEGNDTTGNIDTSDDPIPEDSSTTDSDVSADPAPDASNEENPVTAAVRDKVNETESLDENEPESSNSTSKEELLKKLGNITKNLEDAKKAVMDSIK